MVDFFELESSGLGQRSSDPVMAAINGESADGERSPLDFSAESSDVEEKIVPMSGPDPLELDKPIGEDEFVRQARRAGTDPLTGSDESAIQTRSGSDLAGNNRRRAYDIGTLNGNKSYSDSVSRRDRKDFYEFSVDSRGRVEIDLSDLSDNADLFLHNSRGKAIKRSRRGGSASESISRILNPGDYYVQVRTRSRRDSTDYDLGLNFSELASDNAGNNRRKARSLGSLSGSESYSDFVGRGDRNDFYTFTLDGEKDVNISMDGLSGNADLHLFKKGTRGVVGRSTNSGSSSESINESLGAGTYFLRVKSKGGSGTDYSLSLEVQEIIIDPPPPPQNYVEEEVSGSEWRGSFYRLDGSLPSTNFHENEANKLAVLNLGRGDDKNFSENWGSGSPNSEYIPSDNFALRSYTHAYFENGKEYEFNVSADDGYQIFAKQHGTNDWFDVTTKNEWSTDAYDGKTISHTWEGPTANYDLHFQYYEIGGDAYFNLDWKEAPIPIEDTSGSEWRGSFYRLDGSLPSTNFHENEANKLAILNLGRGDDKNFSENWGSGSPNSEYIPSDNFALRSYTHAYFENGKEYEFNVSADDGYQIFAKQHGTNEWFDVTTKNEWSTDAYSGKTISHTWAGPTGNYDLHFQYYEITGDAYFNLDWKEKGGNDYFNELATWSDEQWDWAAGDNTRITGPIPGWGETDERNYQNHQAVLQIYNDLTTAILGKTYRSSAGYVQDPSYFNDPEAGGKYGRHTGIDIDTDNWVRTDVKALVGGTARVVQSNTGNQFLEIAGDDGRFYWYGHLGAVKVSSGRVNQGDVIGELGTSDASNHLHFQVNETQNKPVGYNSQEQDKVYQWTLNPLKVFWDLKREGRL